MSGKTTRKDLDALNRAQDVFYQACDARAVKQRLELAAKALAISPLCADAYAMLAEHAEAGSEQELDFWRRAVDAGKRALGSDFEAMTGEFWEFVETRPYMRARHGLAQALWRRGEHDAYIDHLKDMLRLNPNDNQGIRYELMASLAEMDYRDGIAALIKMYPEEDSALWRWPIALSAFRLTGDTAESRAALAEAVESNSHVPAYLLATLKLPKNLPPFYSPGEKDEAAMYVAEHGESWSATPGAVEWLRAVVPPAEKKKNRPR